MTTINTLRNALALTFLPLALTAAASAQSDSIGVSWDESFGGSVAGARASALATANYNTIPIPTVGTMYMGMALANADAHVHLFDYEVEAFYFGAAAVLNHSTWMPANASSNISVQGRYLGMTFMDVQRSTSLSATQPIGPFNLFQAEKTFNVGPIPVTVSGAVDIGGSVGLTGSINTAALAISAVPSARAYLQGGAGVAIGSQHLNAGVAATLRLADTILTYTMVADLDDETVTGNLVTQIIPLAIEIEVFVHIVLVTFRKTVYEWALPFSFEFNLLD